MYRCPYQPEIVTAPAKPPQLCAVVAATARITRDEVVLAAAGHARDIDHRAFLDEEVR
jgi:hypothetical protein